MWPIINKILRLPTAMKLLIPVGVIVIISTGYYFLAYRPHQKKLVYLHKEYEKLENKRAEKQNIANNLDKYRAEFAKTEKELKKILVQLPSQKEIPTLLSLISAQGSASGLEFLLFKPSKKETPVDFYVKIPIEIKVMGTYHEVAVFFDRISRLDRIVNVAKIKMDKPKNIDGKMVLTSSCDVITYKYLDEAERAKLEKKKSKNKKKRR